MAKQTRVSIPSVGATSAGIFVLALVFLMIAGYGFFAALFLGLVLAAGIAAFLLLAERRSVEGGASGSRAARATGGTEGTAAAPSPSSALQPEPPARPEPATEGEPEPGPAAGGTSTAAAEPEPEPEPEPEVAGSGPAMPVGKEPLRLDAPRDGGADDLKQLKGIGPKLESELHNRGIFHFDQIASWSAEEVAWMDENLGEPRGRVSRDDWVGQARDLAGHGGAPGAAPRPPTDDGVNH